MGTTVEGYTLLRHRGSGATAEVWSARRDADGHACAIKFVADEARAAAVREVDALSRVRVPGLTRLLDVTTAGDGRLALVLELVDGGVLRDVIEQRGRLTLREALGVLRTAAAVLERLHAEGLVHGDLSAGNILLTRDGRTRVADLGSARCAGRAVHPVVGTRGFVAPELLDGGVPTAAADLYALGVLGWLMLAGELPPPALDRAPLDTALAVPTELADLLDDCLRGEPAGRPSAADVTAALDSFGLDEPLALPHGPDLGGRLTHRLRADALAADDADLDAAVAAVVSRLPRPGAAPRPAGRHRGRAPGRVARCTAPVFAGLTTARGRALLAVVVGAAAGLGLWWTALHGGPVAVAADASRLVTSRPWATASPVPPTTEPQALPAAASSSSQRAAEPLDPAAAVPVLLSTRARAYETADAAALTAAYVPGEALSAAEADVRRLREEGVRYVGLRYETGPVAVLPGASADAARVRVRVGVGAYRVEGPGVSRAVGADPGGEVTLELRRAAGGWRIAGLSV